MDLIGSIVRQIGSIFRFGGSTGSQHQDVRDSAGVVQAGRDVNVNVPATTAPLPTKVGQAYFPDCDLTLDVYAANTGDMQDYRYGAVLVTKYVAQFVAVLSGEDADTFRIGDHQGWAGLPCTLKIAGGPYEGIVSYIQAAALDEESLELVCWFRV